MSAANSAGRKALVPNTTEVKELVFWIGNSRPGTSVNHCQVPAIHLNKGLMSKIHKKLKKNLQSTKKNLQMTQLKLYYIYKQRVLKIRNKKDKNLEKCSIIKSGNGDDKSFRFYLTPVE